LPGAAAGHFQHVARYTGHTLTTRLTKQLPQSCGHTSGPVYLSLDDAHGAQLARTRPAMPRAAGEREGPGIGDGEDAPELERRRFADENDAGFDVNTSGTASSEALRAELASREAQSPTEAGRRPRARAERVLDGDAPRALARPSGRAGGGRGDRGVEPRPPRCSSISWLRSCGLERSLWIPDQRSTLRCGNLPRRRVSHAAGERRARDGCPAGDRQAARSARVLLALSRERVADKPTQGCTLTKIYSRYLETEGKNVFCR